MKKSLLENAQAFQKLRFDIRSTSNPNNKLIVLVDFWQNLGSNKSNILYKSYIDEFIATLVHSINDAYLDDLTIEELNHLNDIIIELSSISNHKTKDSYKKVIFCLAKKFFYVGEIEKGLNELSATTHIADVDVSEFEASNEFDTFQNLVEYARENDFNLHQILNPILIRWNSIIESVDNDGARCLFVEKSNNGTLSKARMRVLVSKIEFTFSLNSTDTVAFDNKIASPNDPFVGIAFTALKAVRNILRQKSRKPIGGNNSFNAHFRVRNSSQVFTGDSIGLAMALVSYIELMKTEISRQDRFLSSDVAISGSIDEKGNLVPINDHTLDSKVQRVFFSPMSYLLIPDGNFTSAKNSISKLRKKYPNRSLQLISAGHLDQVLKNLNIIRTERVCPMVIMKKTINKYTRSTYVQILILLTLIYIMVCFVYPKARFDFDWNPAYVSMKENNLTAFNEDSIPLWNHKFEENINSVWWRAIVYDLNSDGKNEVAFMPWSEFKTRYSNKFFVFNDKGKLLFSRYCIKLNEYPGDTSINNVYGVNRFAVFEWKGNPIIMTSFTMSEPARQHIRFWTAEGDSLGWYINSGFLGHLHHSTDDGVIICDYNNRTNKASIIVLDPENCYGVSPPYTYDLSEVRKGNQIAYISLPNSVIKSYDCFRYSNITSLTQVSFDQYKIRVRELNGFELGINYHLDNSYRVTKSYPDDLYEDTAKFILPDSILSHIQLSTYFRSLKDSVEYFVTQ